MVSVYSEKSNHLNEEQNDISVGIGNFIMYTSKPHI